MRKLVSIGAKHSPTIFSPESGGSQIDMLEALSHKVAQEGILHGYIY